MPQKTSLLRATRGAGIVEYILLAGLIAIACIGGFAAFGKKASAVAEGQAECVRTLDGCSGEAGTGLPGVGGKGLDYGANPKFDSVDDVKDVTYKAAKGTPFNKGPDGKQPAVQPSDISQGQIGDCWFMSSLAAIAAKNPDVLQKGIKDLGGGKYEVTFYESRFLRSPGEVKIVVTADFPAKGDNWRFAQPGNQGAKDGDGNQKLWPMLYEKAYAQWSGGYHKMVGGNAGDGMFYLTGKSSGESTLLGTFSAWDMKFDTFADLVDNNAVTASSLADGNGKKKAFYKDGKLVTGHAYWVESVDRKNQTVTVRNPWGWTSPTVTMSWDDFKHNFRKINYNPTK